MTFVKRLHYTRNTQGFTLIELLVVIAIIGILSGVILGSLNTARGKGADAAAKANLNNMRAQAELIYDAATPNSYSGVCLDQSIKNMMSSAASAEGYTWTSTGNNSSDVRCTSQVGPPDVWVAYIHLVKGMGGANYWCADNTGSAKLETTSPGFATACP